MSSRVVAIGMSVVVAGYLVLLGRTGVALVTTAEPLAVALGIVVLVFPPLGAWAIWWELRFGFAMARMGADLGPDPLPEADRGDVDGRRAYADAHPGDWDAWYRLALACDAARDRRQARRSMVHAWRLSGRRDVKITWAR